MGRYDALDSPSEVVAVGHELAHGTCIQRSIQCNQYHAISIQHCHGALVQLRYGISRNGLATGN